MSSIKAPHFRDVIPACCYNCQECSNILKDAICDTFGHHIDDPGLKVCDAYKVGI